MKTGIIISGNDAETCWNAFRFANFCLWDMHQTARPAGIADVSLVQHERYV